MNKYPEMGLEPLISRRIWRYSMGQPAIAKSAISLPSYYPVQGVGGCHSWLESTTVSVGHKAGEHPLWDASPLLGKHSYTIIGNLEAPVHETA